MCQTLSCQTGTEACRRFSLPKKEKKCFFAGDLVVMKHNSNKRSQRGREASRGLHYRCSSDTALSGANWRSFPSTLHTKTTTKRHGTNTKRCKLTNGTNQKRKKKCKMTAKAIKPQTKLFEKKWKWSTNNKNSISWTQTDEKQLHRDENHSSQSFPSVRSDCD